MRYSKRMALILQRTAATTAAILSVGNLFEPGLGLLGSSSALAAENAPLSLEAYLEQVRERNDAFRGAREASEGARMRSREASLAFAPTLTFDSNLLDDRKPSLFLPTIRGTINNTYSLGVSKAFAATGTQARLAYNLAFIQYLGMPGEGFHIASTQLELRQPLLRGFLGAEARANEQQLRADALARHYEASFQQRLALTEAEGAYWRLNAATEAVKVQREALTRAERILELNETRARLQLADRADVLQAQALVETRRLESQAALDEERSAKQAFNSARGVEGDAVPEALEPFDHDRITQLRRPERAELRDDVLAARERERQANALATLGIERNRPALDVYGTYAMNGQTPGLGDALGGSFSTNIPTRVIGVRMAMPLDFGGQNESRAGYRKEQLGAELVAARKLFEQDREWRDLDLRLEEAKRRYELARAIESAQARKLAYEKERLQRGRSTTFQVLLMESEFLFSQLGRIRSQAEVLGLVSRMKLFSPASPSGAPQNGPHSAFHSPQAPPENREAPRASAPPSSGPQGARS